MRHWWREAPDPGKLALRRNALNYMSGRLLYKQS